MKIRLGLQLVFILVLITSAVQSSDYRILEDLGFTNATSYDLVEIEEEGKPPVMRLRVVNSVPKVDPEEPADREILEAVADTSKQARIVMSRQTNRMLVSGQLRSVLFGLELAKAGVWQHIDTLVRDPSIGQRVRMVIVNGEASELLKRDYKAYPSTGLYIFELLQKESNNQAIPNVNLYHFTRDYYDDGIDAVAPIIKQGADSITLDGIALFHADQYVGRIELDHSLIFAFLRGNFTKGDLGMALSHEEHVLLTAVSSKRKVAVKGHPSDRDSFEIVFHIEVEGSLLEYIGHKTLSDDKGQQQLVREMEEYVVGQADQMLKTVQSYRSDCFGVGQYVRNSMKAQQWYDMDWDAIYPNVKTKVEVSIKIKNYGKFQ